MKSFSFAHLNPFGRKAGDGKEGTTDAPQADATGGTAQAGDAKGKEEKSDDKTSDAEEETEEKKKAAPANERERCAAILAAPAAAGRVELACHLAFNTDLTVEQACLALEAAPSAAAPATGNPNALAAMDAHPNPAVGGAADTSGQSGDDKAAAAVLASMAACGLIPPKKDGK